MCSRPQVPLPLFPPSATVVHRWCNGSTPVAHRNHSHVDRDPHGSGSGVVRVHHAHHMGALPLHYRCTTLGTPSYYRQPPWRQREENPPKQPVRALDPRTEGREHPTPNNQHRTSSAGYFRGHWMLVVRCWLLDVSRVQGVTEAKALGYGLTRKGLMGVTSGWLEGGSGGSPKSVAVMEVAWEPAARLTASLRYETGCLAVEIPGRQPRQPSAAALSFGPHSLRGTA